jgi:hypothetical protein
MTVVYAGSILIRTKRRRFGFGIDSIVVTLIYILGIAGLMAISP